MSDGDEIVHDGGGLAVPLLTRRARVTLLSGIGLVAIIGATYVVGIVTGVSLPHWESLRERRRRREFNEWQKEAATNDTWLCRFSDESEDDALYFVSRNETETTMTIDVYPNFTYDVDELTCVRGEGKGTGGRKLYDTGFKSCTLKATMENSESYYNKAEVGSESGKGKDGASASATKSFFEEVYVKHTGWSGEKSTYTWGRTNQGGIIKCDGGWGDSFDASSAYKKDKCYCNN